MSRVTCAESLEITARKVGESLLEIFKDSRFPCCLTGIGGHEPYGPTETHSYGFLLGTTPKDGLFLPALFRNRFLIGGIWFKNEERQANHKKWVIEVFGREYVEFFKKVAEQLAEENSVDIHVRLTHEQSVPRGEWWQG